MSGHPADTAADTRPDAGPSRARSARAQSAREAAAALPLWYVGGREREVLRWLRRALAAGGSPPARTGALAAASWLAQRLGDLADGRALAEEGLSLARRLADEGGIARGTFSLGFCAFSEGRLAEARPLLLDAVARLRAFGDRGRVAWALCCLASIDSLDAIDEGGDPAVLDRAAAFCEEALRLSREINQVQGISRALHGLAYVTYKQRDFPRSLALSKEVLAITRDQGWVVFSHLEDIADISGRTGGAERAARLYGAADGMRQSWDRPVGPAYRAEFERDVAVARRPSPGAPFATAWAAGRTLTEEQAVAEALAYAPSGLEPRSGILSPRELAVLRLLVEGRSNPEIADDLYISRKTAEHHVSHLLAKLGVDSRTAAVALAVRHGLV